LALIRERGGKTGRAVRVEKACKGCPNKTRHFGWSDYDAGGRIKRFCVVLEKVMTRRPCTFRKSDVTRAAKAVQAAGLEVDFFEFSRDGFRLASRNPVQPNPRVDRGQRDGSAVPVDDLDHELAEFNARHDQD
jgi:hypothetical protein